MKCVIRQSTLFEYRIGNGRLLVCSFNFDKADPAAAWLRKCLVDYAASDEFNPPQALSAKQFHAVVSAPLISAEENSNFARNANDPASVVDDRGAATVGPEWCVAYPDSGSADVNAALKAIAEEVRADVNEATGLKLEAVPASKAKAPAIYIGAEFATKAGFDLSGLTWYDNVVAERDGSIYLFGNDRPGRKTSKSRRLGWTFCVIPSVKAATRFLETAAGVRFLMPGEVGKEVPRRNEIAIADGSYLKESPMLVYGGGGPGPMVYKVANGIWGPGTFHTYGGHTYPIACPASRLFKTHPEYFGMKNGKRTTGSNDGQTPLCISNPKVEDLIVDELKRQFDAGADVCELGQNDGSPVCECEKCRAMYGTGDDWGEKLWLFHRHIAERLLAERPGKVVQIMSYGATAHPPKTFKEFPSNVMVEKCSYSEASFGEWDGYTVPCGFTVYSYLCGNYLRPGLVARHPFAYLAQLARRFRRYNVRGIYRCESIGDLFGTEGPGYYVFNRLLLDGSLNVSALVTDYCAAAFGPAATEMRKFYDTQDSRLRMFGKVLDSYPVDSAAGLGRYANAMPKSPLDLHGWMFSPATAALMEECLSRAEKTAGLSAKQRKRLELVRLEFDYAKSMGAIATLYAAYKLRPTKESFAPLADEIERRNAYLDRLFGGGKLPKRLDGWPEYQPYGYECPRSVMNVNGCLGARIGAPLTWPVADIRASGILPGLAEKSADAVRTDAKPTFAEFESAAGWHELGGISMERVPVKARFKTMYDGENVYFLCESDLADGVTPRAFPRDGGVWTDDCVDMVVAPGDSRDVFYHFIYGVDPESRYDEATGLITDPLDPGYGREDESWNGRGWRTESRRADGKWRSIATFPYSDFGVAAPKPGDKWFINVGRIAKAGANRDEEVLMLWSPNVESRTMFSPGAMGRLVFK